MDLTKVSVADYFNPRSPCGERLTPASTLRR